jgi:outer membrane lipoprotein carrier protein
MKFKTTYNILIFLCMTIFHAAYVIADQQSQPSRIYEEKGDQLMKSASEKLRSFTSLKIVFTYVMENSNMDIDEKMEGILYSKGDKYRMQVGSNLFISDGETIWSYMEDIDEVHINLVENTELALTPTSLLEEFDTQYRSTFIRQEQHSGRLVDIIDLIPNNSQVFFKYRIAIDSGTKMMAYAIAYDRHGGTYTYTIDSYETNPSIPNATFSFSPANFPGIEVIDLR